MQITFGGWLDKILGESWTQTLLCNTGVKVPESKAAKGWERGKLQQQSSEDLFYSFGFLFGSAA